MGQMVQRCHVDQNCQMSLIGKLNHEGQKVQKDQIGQMCQKAHMDQTAQIGQIGQLSQIGQMGQIR